jgi:hypothetical protein
MMAFLAKKNENHYFLETTLVKNFHNNIMKKHEPYTKSVQSKIW